MKRTTQTKNVISLNEREAILKAQFKRIHTLSALVSRATMMANLGYQYDDDREIYEALGYPLTITNAMRANHYERQDIAKAIIDKPVNASWRGGVLIEESTEEEETDLEKAWESLCDDEELQLIPNLVRLDKLVGLGEYGVMLFGLSDVARIEDFAAPVKAQNLQLLYLRPLGKEHAEVQEYVTDANNKRFGKPNLYSVTLADSENHTRIITVHHSRILHVAGELLEGTVEGKSRLDCVFNRLYDLEKLVGGSAEMFWRGARPGYSGTLKEGFNLSAPDKEDLEDQIDEYEHNLRRFLINSGIEMKALEMQVADPSNHVDVQIQMISAVTGIPKRILTGSERGELASSQDADEWRAYLDQRRTDYVEPELLRPFISKLVGFGVLPEPKKKYNFAWQAITEPSTKDKAEVGRIRATALKEYASQPTATMLMPPETFCRFCLGLSPDEIEIVKQAQEKMAEEIEKEAEAEAEVIQPEEENNG